MPKELLLPVSQDVERLVLGAILRDNSLLDSCRAAVTADDFGLEAHKRIWKHVTGLYDAGRAVDYVMVAVALREAGEIESVGGLSYVHGLTDGLPEYAEISGYIKILKDHALRRRVIVAADNLMHRAIGLESPESLMASIGNLSVETAPAASGKGLVSARELVDRVGLSEILSPRIKRGMALPWEWMTYMTCGMLPGELWVLAGHTSTGKSSAAIQAAIYAAQHQSKPVAIFSLEMGDVSVFQRAVWQVSRVDSEKAKRGQLNPEERKRAADAANLLYDLPLYFDDGAFSVMEIHARLRQLRSRGPIGLIVVDYLQLLRDGGRHGSRAEAVGANARALKLMAGGFECPVLLLSQFNRESAKSKPNEQPRRPELYDLKESGDIENHANTVWFVHRPSALDADLIPVEFILAKQRDGRRNILKEFWFLPKNQRFDAKEDGVIE